MIGKQTKGTSFGGCARYVLKEEKSSLENTDRYIRSEAHQHTKRHSAAESFTA